MIKGLLKKDLYNLSSYKATLIIIIIFCGIAIIGTEAINFAPIIICAIIDRWNVGNIIDTSDSNTKHL